MERHPKTCRLYQAIAELEEATEDFIKSNEGPREIRELARKTLSKQKPKIALVKFALQNW
jgi:hypothetical protein